MGNLSNSFINNNFMTKTASLTHMETQDLLLFLNYADFGVHEKTAMPIHIFRWEGTEHKPPQASPHSRT